MKVLRAILLLFGAVHFAGQKLYNTESTELLLTAIFYVLMSIAIRD